MKKLFFLIIALALGSLGLRIWTVQAEKRLPLKIARILSEHYRSVQKSTNWWLTSPPDFSPSLVPLFESERNRILELVRLYRPQTELGDKIFEHAQKMPLGALRMVTNKTFIPTVFIAGKGFHVLAVPQSEHEAYIQSFSSSFHFTGQGFGILTFPAVRMSDAYLALTFLHEYGHGIRWMNKSTGTFAEEEVAMHTLSLDVLKRAVPDYERKVREIIARSRTRDYKRMLAHITRDDLRTMDDMVHGTNLCQEAVAGSMLQHVYSVGFTFIDERRLSQTTKVAIYDWMSEVNRQWVAQKNWRKR